MNKAIVFATGNPHKVKEAMLHLEGHFHILGLTDIDCPIELPENQDTLEGNALEKARYVKEHFGQDCFAEDTGLEVEALDGEPGVYSARYAGAAKDAQANMALLLQKLKGQSNRKARFRTVVALLLDGKEYLFEGIVSGIIADSPAGEEGFGYDPIFIPMGHDLTFAQMPLSAKSEISHRAKAMNQLRDFLLAYPH
ncbi:MAG TPA: RdgB/HAM1 family non-canonical purine NTP pyrophosphatase [Saprospiraceae bacterium]|nr:RdgB/HAM1 family non-canonical purine NTP pyrophosphatase [Saprospiraceae bacterium]HMQ83593.1 RdgB/HAM1 family non-canonical purine NTP pyrophosphatase [Saprospiraceae bacterium]